DEAERSRLLEKLAAYESTVVDMGAEIGSLRGGSAAWQQLHDVATRLVEARSASGFDREIHRLTELQRSQGRSGGKSGSAFESLAADAVREHILPELAGVEGARAAGADEPQVLHRVRLGSSRAEFDQLIVRTPADPTQ